MITSMMATHVEPTIRMVVVGWPLPLGVSCQAMAAGDYPATRVPVHARHATLPPYRPGQAPAIVGVAVPYGETVRVPDGGLECVTPGAFSAFLARAPLVVANVNHEVEDELGTTQNGRLRFEESRHGLIFWLAPSPSELMTDVVLGAMRRGAPAGVSVVWDTAVLAQRTGQLLTIGAGAIREVSLSIGRRPAYSRTFAAIDSPKVRRRLARLDVLGWRKTC